MPSVTTRTREYTPCASQSTRGGVCDASDAQRCHRDSARLRVGCPAGWPNRSGQSNREAICAGMDRTRRGSHRTTVGDCGSFRASDRTSRCGSHYSRSGNTGRILDSSGRHRSIRCRGSAGEGRSTLGRLGRTRRDRATCTVLGVVHRRRAALPALGTLAGARQLPSVPVH